MKCGGKDVGMIGAPLALTVANAKIGAFPSHE